MWRMGLAGLLLLLASCATENGAGPRQAHPVLAGKFAERETGPGRWRLEYGGDRWHTRETVQAFWLYRAAKLTLTQGHDGFAVLQDDALADAEEPFPADSVQVAALTPIFIFIPMGGGSTAPPPPPVIAGDIQLLRAPIAARPRKVFDARRLQAALTPLVNGPRCTGENICPHRRGYLDNP